MWEQPCAVRLTFCLLSRRHTKARQNLSIITMQPVANGYTGYRSSSGKPVGILLVDYIESRQKKYSFYLTLILTVFKLIFIRHNTVTHNRCRCNYYSEFMIRVTVFYLFSEHALISGHPPPILCWWRLLPEHVEIYVYWLCYCVASCNRYLMLINHPTDGATCVFCAT